MRPAIPIRLVIAGLLILVAVSTASAFAAGISVPDSNLDQKSMTVTANDIKPAACGGLSLSNIVTGSGTLTGTSANDLMIGGAGTDTIDGLEGNDCILGGGGDDVLQGNEGDDVCLGGADTDAFVACESEAQ